MSTARYDDCLRCGASVGTAATCPLCGLPTETPDPRHVPLEGPVPSPPPVTFEQPAPSAEPPSYGRAAPVGQQPAYGPPPVYGQPAGYPYPPSGGYLTPTMLGPQPASVGARIGGYLLDWLVVLVATAALGFVAGITLGVAGSGLDQDVFDGIADLLGFVISVVVYFAYYVSQTGTSGRTLGKRVAGTRVVRIADGGVPTMGQALGRYALLFVMFLPCGIVGLVNLIVLANDPQKRGWHDKAAGTVVVTVP